MAPLDSPQVEARFAVNPVIGTHPLGKSSDEAGTSDKSCDWHAHFGKSSGLRHLPSFPNILFLPGSPGENFHLHCTPPVWASTISDPPWVPQFQSLVTPYGMPIPCMCLLGPWFWEAFSFHFIALPPDPYLRPFIPFTS